MYREWRALCGGVMAARALALYLAASLCAARADKISTENNSEKLAKSLRRQLVQNNYDYMSSESQETTRTRVDYRKQLHRYVTPREEHHSSHTNHKEKYRQQNIFISNNKPVSKNSGNTEDLKDENSEINSYIESIDEELKDIVQGKVGTVKKKIPYDIVSAGEREGKRHKYRKKITYDDNAFTDTQHIYNDNNLNMYKTTAKYNIFKLKDSYRRSGSLSTLIQEETPDSVSIVNVGGGPFPEFRLPRARRQYMQFPAHGGAVEEDDELPPPPVNDTNSAYEDTEPKGNDEPVNVHANDNSNNEAQGASLVITVTPDEILVL